MNAKTLRFFLAFLSTILLLSVAKAEEIPPNAIVPVVVVEAFKEVGDGAVDAIAKGLGVPYGRGAELMGRLGLVAPLEEGFIETLETQFVRAQDDFFSGKHETAKLGFEEIITKAHGSPNSLLPPSSIRELVFKAHIYLAIVARGERNEEMAASQIDTAARNFLDFEPASVDFPPWVRTEFDSARGRMKTGTGKVVLDAPEDCELDLLGKKYDSSSSIEEIEMGDYAVSVDCNGEKSPIQRLFVSSSEAVFRPIVLRHSKLRIGKKDLKLEIAKDYDERGLEADLLSIAGAGGWNRLVAIVGAASKTEILLIDTEVGGVVRRTYEELGDRDTGEVAENVGSIASLDSDMEAEVISPKPWYKDSLAWTLVGTGLAAFGGGFALAKIYGDKTSQEVWAWTLMAAGVGAMSTGAILFFVPKEHRLVSGETKRELAIGITGYITF